MRLKVFVIGFLCSIVLFIALNIYSYSQANPPCCDITTPFGIPFQLGLKGGLAGLYINLSGLLANMWTILLIGYLLGKIGEKLLVVRGKLS